MPDLIGWTALLTVVHLSSTAMVLPRPPSSPNHIRTDQEAASDRKSSYEGKSLQGLLHNTNVERPDTEDYRLLEIELQTADEMDAANLQNLVHAMLKQSEEPRNESYPNPEVIPHSILGVRDVGLGPNFRADTFDEDKQPSADDSAKLPSLDEKLYYLKSGKPRVYVNVRGHSGSFRNDESRTTPSNGPVGYLRVTQPFQRQTDWKALHQKKYRPPKKYNRRLDSEESSRRNLDGNRANQGQAAAYSFDDLSTTENSMVTSSELPKQIPAPPSKLPVRTLMAQTTPVQRYSLRRTDILPGYRVTED